MIEKKRVLITGINGQIGSFCAEKWLNENFKVFGFVKSSLNEKLKNIEHIKNEIEIIEGDLRNSKKIAYLVSSLKPHLIINCGAMSHVGLSFTLPKQTLLATGGSVLYFLEAIKNSGIHSRFITCSTSEIFGNSKEKIQNEETPCAPENPYSTAKAYAYYITKIYRKCYNMPASCAILYNCESERRNENFVTKKIINSAVKIKQGKQDFIELGNLDAKRDFMSAKDAVEGLWLMSNYQQSDEFIFATGKNFSIKEFGEKVFEKLDLGKFEDKVKINPKFLRPNDTNSFCGDASKAKNVLGWKPKRNLEQVIDEMINAEIKNEK